MICPFCAEIASGLLPERDGVDVSTREIRRTDNFVVVADISPLVVGHVLVLPRDHVLCFGAISDELLAELRLLLADLRGMLAARYGEPVLLEHGTDSRSDGGGCVSHAHLHLVPGPLDMVASLSRFRVTPVRSLADLRAWRERDEPYVYVGDHLEVGYVADHLTGIPKQFLRIEVARNFGIPDPLWDWRRHILRANLTRTVAELGLDAERRP